jgi:hypothetical protein
MIRYVTVTDRAEVLEVTDMFNIFGENTTDPSLATACVIKLPDGRWWTASTDDVPIYTVH